MPTPLHLKPPTAAWIVRERKRLGLKPADVASRLREMGFEVSEATVKVWESNADRRPSPDNLDGLARLFGSAPPDRVAASGGDQLIAALLRQSESADRQAAAIEALVAEMREAREKEQDVASAIFAALAVLRPDPTPGGGGASTRPGALPARAG